MAAFPVNKRIGLALSGGATRGLAHIGVLKALEDHHIKPDFLSGSSIGAFAAALYAFGVPVKEMRRVGQGMTPLKTQALPLCLVLERRARQAYPCRDWKGKD